MSRSAKTAAEPAVDPMTDAVARALAAATAATDAAHEAEAVLAARSDAALAMSRTVRRTGIMAALAGGAAVVVLALGGLVWMRSAADLREAGEVQAAAAVAFIERIAEMNTALDRMEAATSGLETGKQGLEMRVSSLIEEWGSRMAEASAVPEATAAASPADLPAQLDKLRADILAAIAESELSMAERLAKLPPPPAPVAAPVAAAAPPAPRPASRPAPRPAAGSRSPAAAPSNPFRFP